MFAKENFVLPQAHLGQKDVRGMHVLPVAEDVKTTFPCVDHVQGRQKESKQHVKRGGPCICKSIESDSPKCRIKPAVCVLMFANENCVVPLAHLGQKDVRGLHVLAVAKDAGRTTPCVDHVPGRQKESKQHFKRAGPCM